jgi:tryptophan-rich sensory protein
MNVPLPFGMTGMKEIISPNCGLDTNQYHKIITAGPTGGFFGSIGLFLQNLKNPTFLIVYGAIIAVSLLFLVAYFFGIETTLYKNLIRPNVNTILIDTFWVLATILSYVGLFFLWDNPTPAEVYRNLVISVLFLLGNFLVLAWAAALFLIVNVSLAIWLAVILLIYNFWVFIYVWHIKALAALFLIPILLMYGYLLYSTIHIASLNNILI